VCFGVLCGLGHVLCDVGGPGLLLGDGARKDAAGV
jgi:hypothetical protein